MAIETFNKFLVSAPVNSEQLIIMNPPRGPISKADALLLAAWLVTLANTGGDVDEFSDVLEAVQNT